MKEKASNERSEREAIEETYLKARDAFGWPVADWRAVEQPIVFGCLIGLG